MPKLLLRLACAAVGLFYGWTTAAAATVQGIVTDISRAPFAGVSLDLRNTSGTAAGTTKTDSSGSFVFPDVAPGEYKLRISAEGFETKTEVLKAPATLNIVLEAQRNKTTVDVIGEGARTAAAHHTVDRAVLSQTPVQNQATGLSETVTRITPGVAADGNGFAHPLGEHADTSLSLDGQPITDQQAKIFSNQISTSIIETMDVITGAPPAEYGDKTSLILEVTTRSGLGKADPHGSVSSAYGSFGTWSEGLAYEKGGERWGNFVAADVSGSGRFLDTPEFRPIHDRGNSQSLFDRADWQPRESDRLQFNASASRTWFQTPNTYDAQAAGQDQRSQIRNFNLAPSWTHLLTPEAVLTVRPFLRFDRSQYFPTSHPLADLPATLSQSRYLKNAGIRGDVSYAHGIHNIKIGTSYWRTLLREDFTIGLTDPAYIATPGNLAAYDLTRGGHPYAFRGSADIGELATYAQDSIRLGRLTVNPGLRYDRYAGLTRRNQLQPRFGIAYRLPVSDTVLRLSYARLFETPYNENLIIASNASSAGATDNPFGTFRSTAPAPGTRNQYNAGVAQKIGRYLSVDADYFWKYTHNAFDFDSLFLTPITFPISWRKSKIDGLALRIGLAEFHGFSAYSVMGHTRSRFFGPEIGGLVFNDVPSNDVFRIDHSEEFQHTTTLRQQFGKRGPWTSFSWRYNSGLALPGVVPTYNDALLFTADEQVQMGLYCGDVHAALGNPIRKCDTARFGATRVEIPPPGTQNDDTRPTRVSARNLFDASAGTDDLFNTDRYRVEARVTVLNLTDRVALYNFLSTFSGTHFVAPRSVQVEVKFVF